MSKIVNPIPIRLVRIPKNTPQEVLDIVVDNIVETITTPETRKIPKDEIIKKKIEIAEKLTANGYNPLNLNLDLKDLNIRLKMAETEKTYRKVVKEANQFEDIRNYRLVAPCKRNYVPFEKTKAGQEYKKALTEYKSNIPWYRRIFCREKNIDKNLTNPHIAELSQCQEKYTSLQNKLNQKTQVSPNETKS